jgi:hypothetical protein
MNSLMKKPGAMFLAKQLNDMYHHLSLTENLDNRDCPV